MNSPQSCAMQASADLPGSDRTGAWNGLKKHHDTHGHEFDLRDAFARDADLLPRLATGCDLDGLDASTAGLIQLLRSA